MPDFTSKSGAEVRAAATVALLRDGDNGLEVLMVRRAATLEFHGGAWVFPGGRIDDADRAGADDDVAAARRAAARETSEEAGVHVAPEELAHFASWTTPEFMPKRFATWFFVAAAGEHGDARADGVESDDLAWWKPSDALAARNRREIDLGPPQYVTCTSLARFDSVEAAMRGLGSEPTFHFQPRFVKDDRGAVCVYGGDVAYDAPELLATEGPLHRLLMPTEGDWRYVCTAT